MPPKSKKGKKNGKGHQDDSFPDESTASQSQSQHSQFEYQENTTTTKGKGKKGKKNKNFEGFSKGPFGVGEDSMNQSDINSPDRAVYEQPEEDMEGFEEVRQRGFGGNRDNFGQSSGFDSHVDDIELEGGDGFPDQSIPIRTMMQDEKFGNHRLSKLSIHTNNDEFVFVGGHPPGGLMDGRASVQSARSVGSRKSMLKSTDFLAGQGANDGWGTVRSQHSAQSRHSLKSAALDSREELNLNIEEEEVFDDAPQGDDWTTQSSVPTVMLNGRPISRAGSSSRMRSPDYVTAREAASGTSIGGGGGFSSNQSRTHSRCSMKSGFGSNTQHKFGESRSSEAGGFPSRSRTNSRISQQSIHDGFGESQTGGFGNDQMARSRSVSRSSQRSRNDFGSNQHESGGFGGLHSNGFSETAQRSRSNSPASQRSRRSASRANSFNNQQGFGSQTNGFTGVAGRSRTVSRSSQRSFACRNDDVYGGTSRNNFGGSRQDGFDEQHGIGDTHSGFGGSRKSVFGGSRQDGFEKPHQGDFGGSQNDFGGSRQNGFGGSRQSCFGGSKQGGFDGRGSQQDGFGASRQNDFGGSKQGGFEEPQQIGFGGSRKSVFGGSRQDGFEKSHQGDFGGSQNDFGGSKQGEFEEPQQTNFGGSRQSGFGGSRQDGFEKSHQGYFGGSQNDFGGSKQGGFEEPQKTNFGGSRQSGFGGIRQEEFEEPRQTKFGGSQNDFGASRQNVFGESRQSGLGGSRQSGFGGSKQDGLDEPHQADFGGLQKSSFGSRRSGFGESKQQNSSRRSSFVGSRRDISDEPKQSGFGESHNDDFGTSHHEGFGQSQSRESRKSSFCDSQHWEGDFNEPKQSGFGALKSSELGGSQQGNFGGSHYSVSRESRRSSLGSRQGGFDEPQQSGFDDIQSGEVGGSQNGGFDEQLKHGDFGGSQKGSHRGSFGGSQRSKFGGSRQIGFGSSNAEIRDSSHNVGWGSELSREISEESVEKEGQGQDSRESRTNLQPSGWGDTDGFTQNSRSASRMEEVNNGWSSQPSEQRIPSRAASRCSNVSTRNFQNVDTGFSQQKRQTPCGRAISNASLKSNPTNVSGFGEDENNNKDGSSAGFRKNSDSRSSMVSDRSDAKNQSNAEFIKSRGPSKMSLASGSGLSASVQLSRSRCTSRSSNRSLYNNTDENLRMAGVNSEQQAHLDGVMRQSFGSQSVGSDQEEVPSLNKVGLRMSMRSLKESSQHEASTIQRAEGQAQGFETSNGLWYHMPQEKNMQDRTVNASGRMEGSALSNQPGPWSRTTSWCNTEEKDGVAFSEMPELHSYPQDSTANKPYRRTEEHEKTPVMTKGASRTRIPAVDDGFECQSSQHQQNVVLPIPFPRSRSISRDSRMNELPYSRDRSSERVPIPIHITDALTPRVQSLNKEREAAESPTIMDKTQIQRSYRSQPTHSEIAIQTGETLHRRQGMFVASMVKPPVNTERYEAQPPRNTETEGSRILPFGRVSANRSFENNGHPAVAVLNTLLNQRLSNTSASRSTSPSVSSHQVTMVHNTNQRGSEEGSTAYYKLDTFMESKQSQSNKWQSNTRTQWEEKAISNVNQINQRSGSELVGAKQVIPKEAAEEIRQQVLAESRALYTPKSTRTDRMSMNGVSRISRPSSVQHNQSVGSRTSNTGEVRNADYAKYSRQPIESVSDDISSIGSPYKWIVRGNKFSRDKAADAKWSEPKKMQGSTVRRHIPRGRIRDLAVLFDEMSTQAADEEAVLVLKTGKRERRNSEPSMHEEMGRDYGRSNDDSQLHERPAYGYYQGGDQRDYIMDERRYYANIDKPIPRDVRNNVPRYDYGIEGAFLDIADDDSTESRVENEFHRPMTSTPLQPEQRNHLSRAFGRVPSIRRAAADIPPPLPTTRPRQGRSETRGAVRRMAANWCPSISPNRVTASRLPRRSSSVAPCIQQEDYDMLHKSAAEKRLEEMNNHLRSKRNSSGIGTSIKRRNESCGDDVDEPLYTQVVRGKNSGRELPRRPSSSSIQMGGQHQQLQGRLSRASTDCNLQQHRRFENIEEENLNGQIDNIFKFVEDHDARNYVDDGYAMVEKDMNNNNNNNNNANQVDNTNLPLHYSMSVYRELQRQKRGSPIPESGEQARFSPAIMPAVGQSVSTYKARDGTIGHKVNNTFGTGNRGNNMAPQIFATSTPVRSPAGSTSHAAGKRMDTSFMSSISANSHLVNEIATDYKNQINKLNHMIRCHKEQIDMTYKVLIQARKKQKSLQELSAQRTLLIAKERIALLMSEVKRVSALSAVRRPPPPISKDLRGTMLISSFVVHLNKNFLQRQCDMNTSYAFVVVLKSGYEVEATGPVTLITNHQSRLRHLQFAERIQFSNLSVDFNIILEVYAMKLPDSKQDDFSCASSIANKCRSLLPVARKSQRSPMEGEFIKCGHMNLNRDTTNCTRFYLDDAEYPLEGTIEVYSRCTTLPPSIEVDYRGFLTMYQTIGGMGSWERYWAVLRRGKLCFWKYPDQESSERMAQIDLSQCTNTDIVACLPEQCPRPFAFSIDMLVSSTPSIMEKKRVLLSADSRELLHTWLQTLNETLAIIRGDNNH